MIDVDAIIKSISEAPTHETAQAIHASAVQTITNHPLEDMPPHIRVGARRNMLVQIGTAMHSYPQ